MSHLWAAQRSFPPSYLPQGNGAHYSKFDGLTHSHFANPASLIPQGIDVQPCRSSSSLDDEPAGLQPEGADIGHHGGSQDDLPVGGKPVNSFLQAGGHQNAVKLYQNDPTKIIKDTYMREVLFYQKLAHKLDNTLAIPWGGWKPYYYGWEELSGTKNNGELARIILENLTPGTSSTEYDPHSNYFWHPNVLDIKLGKQLASETADPVKKARKEAMSRKTTSGTFGMRLTGAAIWDNQNLGYIKKDKKYGQDARVDGSDLEEIFNTQFPIHHRRRKNVVRSTLTYSSGGLSPRMMQMVLNSLIPQVEKLLKHVSEFKWSSPATSVLIIYEGDARRLKKVIQSTNQILPKISDVRLIDFAYATEATKVDEGLVFGLKNTLGHLEKLRRNIEELHLPKNSLR
ncbi:hypothetical protein PTTG_06156 [Puccinia triticina 1-1 BBBD Race 1]|uniref:Kinase n=2 Tax=Puccinia triticina TaxID=208348 RepID=A0A180H2X3_PUCT1|nr:uncharacterized protein PtA15_4A143 [Puccinia triticina]OAV99161.1 hypothetical protein PTTG_06156 [Puccinia triticina 1-1 BBBD Race 1]WAQ83695.1 hypothetical protein PtA15_4A143 [Puccinia triticina]